MCVRRTLVSEQRRVWWDKSALPGIGGGSPPGRSAPGAPPKSWFWGGGEATLRNVTQDELLRRIRDGENDHTELKQLPADGVLNSSAIAKALAALANSGGGELIVGVRDNGEILGVGDREAADKVQRQIRQIADSAVRPPVPRRLSVLDVNGKLVIVATVPGFDTSRPFQANGKYYVRSGADSREANPDELVRLVVSAGRESWDESELSGTSAKDIDPSALADFFARGYPDLEERHWPSYLKALHAISEDGSLTPTGLLTFGHNPQAHITDAYVTAIRFAGREASTDFVDRRTLGGTVVRQMEEATAFIERHVPRPSVVEGTVRKERAVPPVVWREALANALAHRDYRVASQTMVLVFDDRVEIQNPGELLNRLTIDSIRLVGVTQRRNPNLAAALARYGGRENAGIGVPDMFRRLREAGLPEPDILLPGGRFHLVVRFESGSQEP